MPRKSEPGKLTRTSTPVELIDKMVELTMQCVEERGDAPCAAAGATDSK